MQTPLTTRKVRGAWIIEDATGARIAVLAVAGPDDEDTERDALTFVEAVNATAWRSPDEPPARTWVLVTISPRNLQYPPRVIEAMYDADRGCWRSRASLGKIDEWLEVTGWVPLPQAKEER